MRTALLLDRYYSAHEHPYRTLELAIKAAISKNSTILEIGCGRQAPMLRKLAPHVGKAIGIDPVAQGVDGLAVLRGSAETVPLPDSAVDLAYCQSVLEHLTDPLRVFREVFRVLRRGGMFIALTPSLWDYGTVVSRIVPNRLHPWIVRRTEGRNEDDTFPAYYRANSDRALLKLTQQAGLRLESIEYLNQYPSYLTFSPLLFLAGTAYERITTRYHSLRKLRGWILCKAVKPAS